MNRMLMQGFCIGLSDLLSDSARLGECRAELVEISAAIGTTVYMDPPDGGSPTLAEQIKRMAKDAARYRWLHDRSGEHQGPEVFIDGRYWLGNELDTAIDAAMVRKP